MTQPVPPADAVPDGFIQFATGLADTPLGQKVALTITILLGKDAAASVADLIKQTTDAMSSTGLVTAAPGMNGIAPKGQR